MNSPLNQGDIVTVYQDPITKQKAEGPADLRRFVAADPDGLQRWMVHFVGDHAADGYERLIDPADRVVDIAV
jgi:hypothetical protein